MNRRFNSRLDSEVLAVHVCNSILEDGAVSDERALRRSEGYFSCCLQGRNMECCSCFGQFTAVLQEIASYGSANADPVFGICKQFARNGALSNGNSGNPS